MTHRPHGDRVRWLYLIPVTVSILIAVQIALTTDFNIHPDEAIHVDAMCYFESHWWPPALNQDGLLYSPDGWSRVYNGEIVYLLYGKMGAWIKPMATAAFNVAAITSTIPSQRYSVFLPAVFLSGRCTTIHQVYRLLNVLLLGITLLFLFLSGRKHVLVTIVGLTLLCIPQVLYVYSYANSDAWGLSVSIFLFIFLLTTPIPIGSSRYGSALGVLIGVLLLSKATFWLSLSWAIVLIRSRYIQQQKDEASSLSSKQMKTGLGLFVITVFLIVAPLKLLYPLSQDNWNVQTEQMREIRSRDDYKPSAPTNEGYRLASRGKSINFVTNDSFWLRRSMQSFYGVFGYMDVNLPNWIYFTALALGLLNIGLTIGVAWLHWPLLGHSTKSLLIAAPFAILLTVGASIYNSWTYDVQPQGRYLFSSLLPLAILLAGTVYVENRWCVLLRVMSWIGGYALCVYVLLNFAV